ncbi:phosphotransferase family protein [Roseicella aquatilis]|uniref:Phosphotransferase family protein n=2 Tax=Roseicella aquatilis TaxID=2527868 RepID=A0A4R4D4M7_9PROT|nr:phosphotransferase family protein [Roseicella aquatilis]
MALLSGGAVQQNWALDVTVAGAAERWVLRTDNAAVLAVSLPRTAEYALLRATHAVGVAVPEPLYCCASREVTGAPFFVMRRVEGIAAGHRLVKAAQGTALAEALGRELARIHGIVPPRPDLPFLGDPPPDAHLALVAAQRAALDAAGTPRPVLEWGLRHLERTAPPPGETVLNHNDFRTGNYMAVGDRVSAVLDWEFAAWGDPHADLGWFCAPCWRFGALDREAGGIGPRAAFYAAYEAGSGRRVQHDRVLWWELAATIRWAVVAADQGGRHLRGDTSLELALTSHIVPELEMDVLRMTGVA